MADKPKKQTIDIVNKSGFPLQIALEEYFRTDPQNLGWHVMHSEHAWENENDGKSGFIGLVVRNNAGTCVLVIECKRVLDTSWIFLCQPKNQANRSQCKAWVSKHDGAEMRRFGWYDVQLEPTSAQSDFCIVRGQSSNSRPMLESAASEVVSATEALAWENYKFVKERRSDLVAYFNVIITTARLDICVVDPENISLADGKISANTPVFETPYVRFRKQLSTRPPNNALFRADTARSMATTKENTVLVLHAELISLFLQDFNFDSQAIGL